MSPAERRELNAGLARLADGDREALDVVYRLVFPAVRQYASRRAPPGDADDVAQQAMLTLFGQASDYDARRDGLAWALTITAWEIRTARRRRARRREIAMVRDDETGCTPESETLDAELRASLAAALGELRPDDAAALLASAGLAPRPAVAGATFRKRVERAVGRLRAVWRRCHGVD